MTSPKIGGGSSANSNSAKLNQNTGLPFGVNYDRNHIEITPESEERFLWLKFGVNDRNEPVDDTFESLCGKVSAKSVDRFDGQPCEEELSRHSQEVLTSFCPPETDKDRIIITKNKQSSSIEKEQQSMQKKPSFKCRYMCTICRTVFEEQSALLAHQNIHTGQKLFKCKKCDFLFVSLDELTVHEKFHCDKRFKCEFCDMAFPRRRDIDTHILTHTGERPYKCRHCVKDFRTKGSCAKHEHQHFDLKFQCETCGAKFAIKNELVKHIPEAHGEKCFQCRTCGKGFNKKARLLEHERVHTEGKNPYKCEICKKSFSAESSLRRHRKGHAGG